MHSKQAPHEQALADERKKKNFVEFWNVISLKDPFRLVLSEMRDRLFHTREILHHCLVHTKCGPSPLLPLHVTPFPATLSSCFSAPHMHTLKTSFGLPLGIFQSLNMRGCAEPSCI